MMGHLVAFLALCSSPSSSLGAQVTFGAAQPGRCVDRNGKEVRYIWSPGQFNQRRCALICASEPRCLAYAFQLEGSLCVHYGARVPSGAPEQPIANTTDVWNGWWLAGRAAATSQQTPLRGEALLPAENFACKVKSTTETAFNNHLYIDETAHGPRPGSPEECARFEADADTSWDNAESLGWRPGTMRRGPGSSLLYGTAYAQSYIRAHQHPSTCEFKRIMAMEHQVAGIGSLMHHLARALGWAMHTGRILTIVPEGYAGKSGGASGMPWYDPEYCKGRGPSWECWFQPVTSCYSTFVVTVTMGDLQRHTHGAYPDDKMGFSRHYVPEAFHEMLRRCSRIKPSMWYYWWHAQAVAYIFRFNADTRRLLDDMRRARLYAVTPGIGDGPFTASALPRGTIAAHIRHGEKANEMKLMPLAKYVEQVARLAAGDQHIRVLHSDFAETRANFSFHPKEFATRGFFVSSEDEAVFDDARALVNKDHAWRIFYVTDNRTNWDPSEQMRIKGAGQAALDSFLNLELSVEADAWVCTLFSNWCMLIDELRMTLGGKAAAPFINLNHRKSVVDPYYRYFHPRSYTLL